MYRTFFSNLNQMSSDKEIRVPNHIDPNFYYTTFNVLYLFSNLNQITSNKEIRVPNCIHPNFYTTFNVSYTCNN